MRMETNLQQTVWEAVKDPESSIRPRYKAVIEFWYEIPACVVGPPDSAMAILITPFKTSIY